LSLAPELVDLAAAVSIAHVDPALLRIARRSLHPGLTHEAEAAVFHSPLAESRGHHGFMLREEHLPELRLRLVEDGRLDAARAVVCAVHADAPQLVRLEEELTYALLVGGEPAVVERILGMAVAWLRDSDDRRPASRWILRVCRRAPEQLWADPRLATWAFSLVQAASAVLGGARPGRPTAGSGPTLPVLDDRTMPIGVRLNPAGLVLSGTPDGPTRIEVPAAWPVVLSVTTRDGEPATVTLHDPSAVVTVPTGLPATVTTVSGRRFEVRQAAATVVALRTPVAAVAWSVARSAFMTADRFSADVGYLEPVDLRFLDGHPAPGRKASGPVDPVVLAAGGTRLAAVFDSEVRLWNSRSARVVAYPAPTEGVRALAVAADADVVAVSGRDGGTVVWGLTEPGTNLDRAGSGPLALSSRARLVAWVPDERNSVLVHNLSTSVQVDVLAPATALAFSPDERILALGTDDGSVLLSTVTASDTPRTAPEHTSPVDVLAFSPDGRLLASGDRAGVIHVWTVAELDRPIATWIGHSGAIVGLAWAPDNARVVSAGADDTLRSWDLPRAAPPVVGTPAPSTAGSAPMRLTVLPAGHGTALVLELGSGPRPFRLVVNGGPRTAYAGGLRAWAARLPADQRTIDALAVTHSGSAAVEGVVALLGDADLGVTIADLWYNGWRHASRSDSS
jgi:WD40 repeat protein